MKSKKKGSTRARNNVRSDSQPLGDVGEVGAGDAKAKAELKTATQEVELRGMNEARVESLADMMRALTFKTGVTVRDKANEWGLSEQRIRELTAIASKRVRAEFSDSDRIVAKVTVALEKVIDDAIRETDEPALIEKQGKDGPVTYQESPNGARKVLIDAAKTLCVLTGNAAPTKHVVTNKSFEGMTRDEHLAELRRLKGEIEDEERRLEGEAKGTLQ